MPNYDRKLWPNRSGRGYVHGYHLGIYIEVALNRRKFLIATYYKGKQVKSETRDFDPPKLPEPVVGSAPRRKRR